MKYESMKLKSKEDRPFVLVPVLHEKTVATNLRSQDCLVYGYLLFLARKQNKVRLAGICESLRLDRLSAKQSLQRLLQCQLVDRAAGEYTALPPLGSRVFRLQESAAGEWHQGFIYDRVYLPCSPQTLPVRANLLFWHLVRMAEPVQGMPGHMRVGGSGNRYYTHTYLGRAIGCDRKTSGACMARLAKLNLLRVWKCHKGYAIGILPLEMNCHLWRESWHKKPRVLPTITAQELFGLPSPAPLQTETTMYGKIVKVLRRFGITGKLGEEMAVLIDKEEVCPTIWRPMLEKAYADNFANLEDGKTQNLHCGFLFRSNLEDWLEVRAENRPFKPRITSSEEIQLSQALGTLKLGYSDHDLLQRAINSKYLVGDDDTKIPCPVTAEKVIALATAAQGKVDAFKLSIAKLLFVVDNPASAQFDWYREWMRGTDHEVEDNSWLQNAGVSEAQWSDVRSWANFCLTKNHAPGTGRVVGRINTVLRMAAWQTFPGKRQLKANALMATIEDLCSRLGGKVDHDIDADQKDEEREGEISARSREIGKQWLARSK